MLLAMLDVFEKYGVGRARSIQMHYVGGGWNQPIVIDNYTFDTNEIIKVSAMRWKRFCKEHPDIAAYCRPAIEIFFWPLKKENDACFVLGGECGIIHNQRHELDHELMSHFVEIKKRHDKQEPKYSNRRDREKFYFIYQELSQLGLFPKIIKAGIINDWKQSFMVWHSKNGAISSKNFSEKMSQSVVEKENFGEKFHGLELAYTHQGKEVWWSIPCSIIDKQKQFYVMKEEKILHILNSIGIQLKEEVDV